MIFSASSIHYARQCKCSICISSLKNFCSPFWLKKKLSSLGQSCVTAANEGVLHHCQTIGLFASEKTIIPESLPSSLLLACVSYTKIPLHLQRHGPPLIFTFKKNVLMLRDNILIGVIFMVKQHGFSFSFNGESHKGSPLEKKRLKAAC